ncbi:hypothetical protein H072_10174 [Dactylellina haptotyla CBS 200.50]|uniref:FAD/NAD(P)-binding domain-containing protein n=1 Tax=Dactylellina haptotyla (strain CBS 200.50) TaxID=1284197 RepID=S8BAY0_DACHA|nr:hypothetical protein H072_10174 [Dactylellina haptotyla CBS 200.50]
MDDRIAVLGLGCTGLACLKNLREQGLNAIGFDRNKYIGGIWQYTTNENVTSVIQSTTANEPKYRFTFSDYEYPPGMAHYPPASEIAKYINGYAEEYDLLKHCRLGVAIKLVERSQDGQNWNVTLKANTGKVLTETYSRVVVCTGPQTRALFPAHVKEGRRFFKGRILHSQGFKDPKQFANQRVVVVGLSNTAGDVAVDLAKVCDQVFIAHRSGARIIARVQDGPPLDYKFTRRVSLVANAVSSWFPRVFGKFMEYFLESTMKSQFPQVEKHEEWRLLPAPPMPNVVPMMNDNIIRILETGKIKSVNGLKGFKPDGSVELNDGQVLENIDTVIYCTGYEFDYSIFGEGANPTSFATPEWDQKEHAKSMPYPRLYQGIFSTKYPESLAFIGPYRGYSFSHMANCDLASAALAQVWKGNYPLPTKVEMERWCNAHYQNTLIQVSRWRIFGFTCNPGQLEKWLNNVSGNGINEKLGWGWEGWSFWWNERQLYHMIMDGVDTVFLQRLFDGRGEKARKKWPGARDAILRANSIVN